MFSPLKSSQFHVARSAADAPREREPADDEVALGCECADPALQIERWGSEAAEQGALSA